MLPPSHWQGSNLSNVPVDLHGSLRCHMADIGCTVLVIGFKYVDMQILGVVNWLHTICENFPHKNLAIRESEARLVHAAICTRHCMGEILDFFFIFYMVELLHYRTAVVGMPYWNQTRAIT